MPITLTGLASGLDTESIISQLMQIEQTKVTAVQKRQVSVNQHKTDLQTIKTQARRLQDGGDRPRQSPSLWKPKQTTDVLGPDEGRSHRARRRRHRRPVDPGRPPRVLRAARLQLHGRLRARARSASPAAAPPLPSTSRPTPPPPMSPRPSTDRQRPGVRGRRQGRRRRQARLLLAHHRPELGFQRRHVAARRGHRPQRGQRLHAHGRDAQRVDQGQRGRGAEPRVQRARDDHPGRPPDAEGHHGEPGHGEHHLAGRRPGRDHQEGHVARRRLQRRRHVHAARS